MNWAQLMRDGLLMAAIFYSFAAAAAALQPQRAAAGPEESPRSMRRAACHKCVFCMPALPVLYGAARLVNAVMAALLPASLLQWAVVALCGIAAAAAPPYGHTLAVQKNRPHPPHLPGRLLAAKRSGMGDHPLFLITKTYRDVNKGGLSHGKNYPCYRRYGLFNV